jgi:UDP-glucose 4-epimerase
MRNNGESKMELRNKKIVVTGGAGFIGSHLVDRLVNMDNQVIVVDNLSAGKLEFLSRSQDKIEIIKTDLMNPEALTPVLDDCSLVVHLAANPQVKIKDDETRQHIDQNILMTYYVLDAMRKSKVPNIIFASTSTVYGEAEKVPTPENYGPLVPISLYGASKLACEALISAYCYSYNMHGVMYRFANVIGARSTHGVIFDFINKLKADPKKLEILGREPGTDKSYIHISDTVNAMIHGFENAEERVGIFNIGTEDSTDVKTLANTVCKVMNLEDVAYDWTGGVDDGRGWKGDVRIMILGIDKVKALGWVPKYTSTQAVELTASELTKD